MTVEERQVDQHIMIHTSAADRKIKQVKSANCQKLPPLMINGVSFEHLLTHCIRITQQPH